MSSQSHPEIRLALLHQAIEPPIINGLRKPMKPGGYQDSCADIAFTLSNSTIASTEIQVLTPSPSPSPTQIADWSFPDTLAGILSALQAGATHIWANTILFSSHPLQASEELEPYLDSVHIIGQPSNLMERFDDKEFVNDFLRSHGGFTLPKSWSVEVSSGLTDSELDGEVEKQLSQLQPELPFPVVGKPIRGRGSYGVKVCHSLPELKAHLIFLLKESPRVMIESYLPGEEATITVMPPSSSPSSSSPSADYLALPAITRFNHADGVAPYNGTVAVTANSRLVSSEEYAQDPAYEEAGRACSAVAKLLRLTAMMRIDIRRVSTNPHAKFAIFDVNVKPNITGPGRPGRDDQMCLSGMAAQGLGWDYERLLLKMLGSARTLSELRGMKFRE